MPSDTSAQLVTEKDDELDDLADDNETELNVTQLYQLADLESDIDPEHHDALEDANCEFLHDYAAAAPLF